VSASRARGAADVRKGAGGEVDGAASSPRKRKRPDQAKVGRPFCAVIKVLPTAGLVDLGKEVMHELQVRLCDGED
jgi:hypothetical protein